MDKQHKAWIDGATIEEMVYARRQQPLDCPLFEGDTEAYFDKVLVTKGRADVVAYQAASDSVEWNII